MTLCEYRYGDYDHNGSLFAFLLRSGVGGGFVNQQGIYTSEYKTLEPGHISINYKGPSCYCGTKGCLQAYLIELDSDYDREEGGLLFKSLEQKLANDDPGAKKIIQKAADYTFLAMKSIMRFFSPHSFLILGNGGHISSHIAEHIKKHWECETDVFMSNPPLIFSSTWNPLASQRGASDLVISHYFS
jgi:predicted NBD/HSP70 family sugar kinase